MKLSKKCFSLFIALSIALLSLSSCGNENQYLSGENSEMTSQTNSESSENENNITHVTSDTLFVKKVDNLPEDFIFGMDASCVPALEKSGVKYYDYNGDEKDVYEILALNGINYIRVRIWNDPFDSRGFGYGGGNCNLDNAIEIGKRATKHGMKLLVNFHYSDFWADPGKQMTPKEWVNMSIDKKSDALYQYTKSSLEKLKASGIDIGMVQIGNETNGAMCGENSAKLGGWKNIATLMSSGSKAVREVCPEALVAIHFTNPENPQSFESYGKNLQYYAVDYDVFATSYYPYWHGTLENLSNVLSKIAENFNKKVMVAETSYAFNVKDTDFSGNTIGEGGDIVKNYPFTIQGQANCVRDIIDTIVNKTTNGIGVFYWEGTWIGVGGSSYEENFSLWEKYGSGWASSYASSYDYEDAGKWYGGCAVENQAFFDEYGKVTESLKVFSLVKDGNNISLNTDAVEDTNLIFDLKSDIVLPNTVNAIMSDNSMKKIPVSWHNVDIEAMKNNGVAKYTISGTADGMKANCYISMVEYNYLNNWSFEEGEKNWIASKLKNFNQLGIEEKVADSLTGENHYHFWGENENTVEFTLEQNVKDLHTGSYSFSMSIMGGDGGNTEIYAYVKINGEITHKAHTKITSYNEWHKATINSFDYNQGDNIAVGIYVKCQGPNAWGKIDDAMLNAVK